MIPTFKSAFIISCNLKVHGKLYDIMRTFLFAHIDSAYDSQATSDLGYHRIGIFGTSRTGGSYNIYIKLEIKLKLPFIKNELLHARVIRDIRIAC